MEKIILASTSPRRAELLRQVGCDFEVIAPPATAEPLPMEGESPKDFVVRSAIAKCGGVAENHPDRVVLAADTVVVLDGRILGKPLDRDDAAEMLRALSEREHQVMTGVAVRRGASRRAECATTSVHFRKLSDGEIERYVATGEPMDKAGAYGIQGVGALLVEGIDGDYSNVVGLPLCTAAHLLKVFGVELL